MQLSELDLFKLAENSPVYLKSLTSASKVQYKVWSGFTKYLKSTINKSQAPTIQEFGKFLPTSPPKFIPSVQFLTATKVHFPTYPDTLPSAYPEKSISYTAISEVCSIDRETVILCFKELLGQISKALAVGQRVILNLKVGKMTLNNHLGEFIGQDQVDPSEKSHSMSVATPRSSRFTTVSSHSSVHPSNPNPLHQGPSANLNNYYRGLRQNPNPTSHLSPVGFYTGQIHPIFNFRSKFTRKQACEQPLSPEDLLRIHQDQIKEKKKRLEMEKNLEVNDFNQAQKTVKNNLKTEREYRLMNEYEKRKAYESANLEKVQEKLQRTRYEQEIKKNETYDYFPFVHGDEVEAKTKSLNLSLKEDLQNYMKSVESSPLKISKEPVVAVPKFLQTSEYLNMRRTQNYHVEKTMKGALESYCNQIKTLEKAKEREKKEKALQDMQDEAYYKQLEITRKKEIQENLKELNEQIDEKMEKKFQETVVKKNLYSTSLELTPNQHDDWNKKKKHYDEYQKYIIEQIEDQDKKVKKGALKERELDTKILSTMENMIQKEDNEAKLNEVYSKTLNKEIWIKQMQIKELEKEAGKVL